MADTKAADQQAAAEADADEEAEPTSKPISGGVDVGEKGGGSLVSVVAGAEIRRAAKAIAKAVKATNPGAVALLDERSVATSDVVYAQVTAAIKGLGDLLAEFETAFPVQQGSNRKGIAPAAAVAALVGFGKVAADFVGLFRSDFKVGARDVTVNRLALVAEVGRALKANDVSVVILDAAVIANSKVFGDLQALVERRHKLEQRATRAQFVEVDPKVASLDAAKTRQADLQTKHDDFVAEGKNEEAKRVLPLIEKARGDAEAIQGDSAFQSRRADLASLKAFLTAFDAAVTSMVATPTGGTTSPLVAAALRERLRDTTAPITHLLFVDVTASGGDVVTKSSLWGWNTKAAFLGAVQATFVLTALDGTLAASGAQTAFGRATYNFEKALPTDVVGWDSVNALADEL